MARSVRKRVLSTLLLVALAAPAAAQVRIDRVEPDRVCPGEEFAVVGSFGAEPDSGYSIRIGSLRLTRGDGVITWARTRLSTRLPARSLSPGTYQLELWIGGRRRASLPGFRVACEATPRELTPGPIRGPAPAVRVPTAELRVLRVETSRCEVRRSGDEIVSIGRCTPAEAGSVRVGDVVRLCVHVENSGDTEAFAVPRVPSLTRRVSRGCGSSGGGVAQTLGQAESRIPPSRTVQLSTFVEITPQPIRNQHFRHTVMLYDASGLRRQDAATAPLPLWRDSNKNDNAKEFSIAVGGLPYSVTASVPRIVVHKTCDSFSPGDWFFLYGLYSVDDESLVSDWRRLPPRGTRDVDGGGDVLRPSPGVDTTVTLSRLPREHSLGFIVGGYDCDNRRNTDRTAHLPAGFGRALLSSRQTCTGEEPGELGANTDETLHGRVTLTPEQWRRGGTFTVTGSCGTDRGAFEMTFEVSATPSR